MDPHSTESLSNRIVWEELEPAASGWECVWNDKEKLEWAKQAWAFITDAGLSGYSSPLERAKVVIRFLALAGIFSDFYEIAFSDGFKPDYWFVARELEVTPFRLGQLVGSDPEWDDHDEDDMSSLLHSLAADARKEVYNALISGFGDVSSLFISLWRINASAADYADDDDEDNHNSIVNRNLTPEKFEAFEWLREGCYPWG